MDKRSGGSFWDLVIERVSRRLEGWRRYCHSLYVTLSCLSSIPIYYMSLFRILVGVENRIERLIRIFLWNGVGDGRRNLPGIREHEWRPKAKGF